MSVIQELRKDYETRGLNRADMDDNPMHQFELWFNQAVEHCPGRWYEPNAMTLSTHGDDQKLISSRTVLLKHFDDQGLVFFTNYGSEKGQQIAATGVVAALFHWPYLARQIRFSGIVEKTSREMSEMYFHSRPRRAQLGALASAQSAELKSREHLVLLTSELDEKHKDQPVPLPDSWGGYRIKPFQFEFWQGKLDRLHDRFKYELKNDDLASNDWVVRRLYP